MPAGAITLADITSADWSLALGAIGDVAQGIADVEQCLGIIVTTPRGSDPLRPTFGADIWRFIDFPINRALPAIVSELTSAITVWEPRVTLVSVTAQPVIDASTQSGAHLDVTLNWQLKLGAAATPVQSTTVTITGATA
jgi:phage baseplate assembly protein W